MSHWPGGGNRTPSRWQKLDIGASMPARTAVQPVHYMLEGSCSAASACSMTAVRPETRMRPNTVTPEDMILPPSINTAPKGQSNA